MAGAFGYEKGEHYDVSIACGERVLLPKVRAAPDEALIVTDGFSCREQIQQETDREALHLAEVIRLAMYGGELRRHERPEARLIDRRRRLARRAARRTAATVS